jgi:UDP-N-acetylmuramoyl-tripeptide--D-alanyl-D-alanine ligase
MAMIRFSLREVAEVTGGRLLGDDASFARIGTDTRSLEAGSMFVALRGERFDGHRFLDLAHARGAVAAMISEPVEHKLPRVLVNDTRLQLGQLAAAWRQRAGARVVAVTGSNGKTTVKEMLAAILGQHGSVLATKGNLNNDIGVPLTLSRLQDQDYAVVEMGANHLGEIRYLSCLTKPEVAILNNAGRAHLEGFGSIEGVARAKAEIMEGLIAGGAFVMNADDVFAGLWRQLASGRRIVDFGYADRAMVRSDPASYRLQWNDSVFHSNFPVTTPDSEFELRVPLAGRHNQCNALAAVAAAWTLGLPEDVIRDGLASLQPVPGRLRPMAGCLGLRLIDDSYNANPDSVAAAIEVLAMAPGRRILVLGDLAELGGEGANLHAELGERARAAGIHHLYAYGSLAAAAANAFGSGGHTFQDQQQLIDSLQASCSAEDAVLVKGSRTSRMDRVVLALSAEGGLC